MSIMRVLIGHNPCLDKAIRRRKCLEWCYCIKQLLYRLQVFGWPDQTLGNVTRVKKTTQNRSPSARFSHAFLNSRNMSACMDKAIQIQKP